MPDDTVTVRPSLPRAWVLSAICVTPMVAFMIVMGFPFGDRFFLVGSTIVLAMGIFLFGVFFWALFSCQISREGLEPSFSIFPYLLRWEEVKTLTSIFPFAFYMARGFVIVPRLWLQKDPKAFREALGRYAPDGHVLRRVFLENERPILRDALVLVLIIAALSVLLTFLYYERHDPLHDAVSAGRMAGV